MNTFDEAIFRNQVDKSLVRVRQILDTNRHPQYATDINHHYDDKYNLSEFLTKMALSGILNCLNYYGLSAQQLKAILQWVAENKAVTLRFKSHESCAFLKEIEKSVESKQQHVTEIKVGNRTAVQETSKTITKIKEYFWRFEVNYELIVFYGAEDQMTDPARVILGRKSGFHEVKTSTNTPPYQEKVACPPIDVDITWLLSTFDSCNLEQIFGIQRNDPLCRTPRRNPQVEAALLQFQHIQIWCEKLITYFTCRLFPVQSDHNLHLTGLTDDGILVPVLPLFEYKSAENQVTVTDREDELAPMSVLLDGSDANALLQEQRRSMQERIDTLTSCFPEASHPSLITILEARLVCLSRHLHSVCVQYEMCVSFIEDMLRKQLMAAIGREVTSTDFSAYMRFHSHRLFKEQYRPQPFCYSVRRTAQHSPEGVVSIEQGGGIQGGSASLQDPIHTLVHRNGYEEKENESEVCDITFSLSAATTVTFRGERFLHAWLTPRFPGDMTELRVCCRAKQFSSFIVLLGRIGSATEFIPKYGLIVQNQDDIQIPLDLEYIPSPKEFAEAIQSLSPEQQRFARAYRSMQLESTMFAMCVIQIKPQLEAVLNLPEDSLTKEIRLTQDLMSLFIEYQIPSDLLSYNGREELEMKTEERVNQVKRHVQAMLDLIEEAKKKEIKEKKQQAQYQDPFADGEPPPRMLATQVQAFSAAPKMRGGGREFGAVLTGFGGFGGAAEPVARCAPRMRAASPVRAVPPPPPPDPCLLTPSQDTLSDLQSAVPPPASPGDTSTRDMSLQEANTANTLTSLEDSVVASKRKITVSYSKIPGELDTCFSTLDPTAAVRPCIFSPSAMWTKRARTALLSSPTTSSLYKDEQRREKEKAFDLIDALSRSGGLVLHHVTLHVLLGAGHSFEKSIIETVLQENINPIERVERSLLITSSVIHCKPVTDLIRTDHISRVQQFSSMLFTPIE
mmetsp:Transcript_8391/g.8561  ORF Transcript_8391/g.8561 Transcript_8391/m.8561 type:complete len:961 (+) Transcript_8391:116-2998(+)|eukprot:CAMPEP_0182416454 /NCGR_PEP_ID=MMETSP1167-20130531/743_1 /TAXON_ID=2988 /ORGANISM="Mallomonas Sp, Strain CCMP3275" /LENGTH=960 /DNA_ID=CAMNT_0024589219 /DNA_START=112 /DNA_END=2994 /DNA_ORIENTATION=-